MSGFVSFVSSTFLFVFCFAFGMVYFGKGRRYRKTAIYWAAPSLVFAVIGVISGWYYFTAKPPVIYQPTVEKQYTIIKTERLEEDLAVGKRPTVILTIENGPGESTLTISNVTFHFTRFVPERYLKYNKAAVPKTSKMGPHQSFLVQLFPPDGMTLTQDQIDDLQAKPPTAELYIYARGNYSNESGTHPFDICRKYDKDFPNLIVFCDDIIKIE